MKIEDTLIDDQTVERLLLQIFSIFIGSINNFQGLKYTRLKESEVFADNNVKTFCASVCV